jgi:hypothetical protein
MHAPPITAVGNWKSFPKRSIRFRTRAYASPALARPGGREPIRCMHAPPITAVGNWKSFPKRSIRFRTRAYASPALARPGGREPIRCLKLLSQHHDVSAATVNASAASTRTPAHRTGHVRPQPRIDASVVKQVRAHGELLHRLPALQLAEADGAVVGGAGLLLVRVRRERRNRGGA